MTFITRRAVAAALALSLAPFAALSQEAAAPEAASLEARGYALGEMAIGAEDAPVTVIEYASLTCPHCATFHGETWPEIKEKYVDTGQVRFVFREVYFDQLGLWASMIARCGGEQPFFGYVDAFFSQQESWSRADDAVEELQRIGRLGGLSSERLQACLTDEDFMRHLVERYQENAGADDIQATPTFLIGDERQRGAVGVEAMSAMIDEALGS